MKITAGSAKTALAGALTGSAFQLSTVLAARFAAAAV